MAYNPVNPNGQAVMASSAPVVLASDHSAVPILGSRPKVVTGTLTYAGTSYATSTCFGGLLTIATGLASGTILTAAAMRFKTATNPFSTGTMTGLTGIFFSQNPTASTFTDGSAYSIASADDAKIWALTTITSIYSTQPVFATVASGNLPRIPVDSSGDIFFACWNNGATNPITFAAGGSLAYEFDFLY